MSGAEEPTLASLGALAAESSETTPTFEVVDTLSDDEPQFREGNINIYTYCTLCIDLMMIIIYLYNICMYIQIANHYLEVILLLILEIDLIKELPRFQVLVLKLTQQVQVHRIHHMQKRRRRRVPLALYGKGFYFLLLSMYYIYIILFLVYIIIIFVCFLFLFFLCYFPIEQDSRVP